MSNDWYYVQNGQRHGPVSFDRLKHMAATGWLAADDLVWREDMADWKPAAEAEGLFGIGVGRLLHKTIAGLRTPPGKPTRQSPQNAGPPGIPPKPLKVAKQHPKRTAPLIAWDTIAPRHVIAAGGGLLAALGIAFTAIAQSSLALSFTLSGLFIAAVGFYVEVGKLLGQAVENIGKASKEAADRRLRAKELALEKQKLELEAARLTQEQMARAALPLPSAVLGNQPTELVPTAATGTGQVLVINHPPVQRWSPGLAAVLSFFMPGLGQLYKGQILNGIVWFFVVGLGYVALIVPGLVLHLFCVLGALSGNPWTEAKTTVVRQ